MCSHSKSVLLPKKAIHLVLCELLSICNKQHEYMGLFDRWFGGGKNFNRPDVQFGRYSDHYRTKEQEDFWKTAVTSYEKQEYMESFRAFFQSLQANGQDSIQFEEKDNALHFELLQGSKKVHGFANNEKFAAHAKVVHADRLNVGFMRRLLEHNHALKYSRLSLDDDNNICIKFDSYIIDASPYKLYAALKELSTSADKQDDLLADEFDMLHQIDSRHIIDLPEEEKKTKYSYIKKWTDSTFTRIEELDPNKFKIGINYLLLNLIYKMDYLVVPEGVMMETLEKCHHLFFAPDGKTPQEKSQSVVKELKEMVERPEQNFHKEMYRVPSTFSITAQAEHAQLAAMIEAEMPSMDWYLQNEYFDLAAAIAGFVSGHFLFYFRLPQPDREYLHLLFEILEPEYFKALGFEPHYYNKETKEFDKSAIKNEINNIAKANKERFPKLAPDTKELKYTNLPEFARSFLFMVKALDMTSEKKAK